MKTKTLENFYKAGNALLNDNFYDGEGAIIAVSTDGKMKHGIKGKSEDVGFMLYEIARKETLFFHLMKHVVQFIEKEKQEGVDEIEPK
jgi:hypothetical protein